MKKLLLITILSGLLFAGTAEDELNALGAVENAAIQKANTQRKMVEEKYGKEPIVITHSLTRSEEAKKETPESKLNALGAADNAKIKEDNKRRYYFEKKYGKTEIGKKSTRTITRTELDKKIKTPIINTTKPFNVTSNETEGNATNRKCCGSSNEEDCYLKTLWSKLKNLF